MSTTIDEKVVEMRFDNEKFEKNVAQSMSTLDKLKAKLNFKDAAKSFEELENKTSNISFDKMAQSVEAIEKRFSTMGIVGMRVIQNLTDSAMHLVNKAQSFVTGGIINGGLKRATNIINARFQLQGLLKDSEAVEAVMKNVSDSVDGTAYSMDAAASVASQLAASGMRAGDEMFSALRGVAGVAAMTNSSYEDIGRIYTQVAGQGKLMGDQLLQLSGRGMNAAATLATYLEKTEAEVRDMTSKGQIDFSTFAAAMDSTFGEHAKEANSTFDGALANIRSALARTGQAFFLPLKAVDGPFVKLFNAIRTQVNNINTILNPATTDLSNKIGKVVESFAELVEKVDLSPVANTISNVITAAGNLVSKIDFSKITAKITGASNPYSDLADKIKEVTTASTVSAEAVQDLGDVVNRVINGEFGNAPERYEKLTAAGFDWAAVQNKVNEQLGDSTRHEEAAAQAQESLAQTQAVTIESLKEMSDEQLKNIGFTDDQVTAFRELEEQSKKTGIPIEDLMNNVDQLSAKSLLLSSFKNIGESLVKTFKAMGTAFGEIFGGKNADVSGGIYSLIEGFHKLTTKFQVNDEEADKLRRTFKGLFAVIDLISNVVGGTFKIGLKVLNAVLSAFNLDILDVTAGIGDFLVKFHDFVEENDLFNQGVGLVVDGVKALAEGIKGLVEAVEDIPQVQDTIQKFKDMDLSEIGSNIIAGLRNGLEKGIQKIPEIMTHLGEIIISTIKGILGIHSPSTVFFEIAQNIVQGLINGLKAAFGTLREAMQKLGGIVVDKFSGFDFSKIYAIGAAIALIYTSRTIGKALDRIGDITSVFKSASKVMGSVSKAIDELGMAMSKNLKAKAFKTRMSAIADLIKSIVLLVGAVVVLAEVNKDTDLSGALMSLGIIMGLVVGFTAVMSNISKESASIDWKKGIDIKGMQTAALGLGICILAISSAVKGIGQLEPEQYQQGLRGVGLIILGIGALIGSIEFCVHKGQMSDFTSFAEMLEKMAISFGIMALVIKILGNMDSDTLNNGYYAIVDLAAIIVIMTYVTSALPEKDVEQFGNLMLKLSASFIIMALAMKMAGKLSSDEIRQASLALLVFAGFVGVMAVITNAISDKQIAEFGIMVLAISAAIYILVKACQQIKQLELGTIGKGVVFLAGFLGFVALLTVILKKKGEVLKVGATLLSLSVAIGIIVGVMFLIDLLKPSAIAKGIIVIGFLSIFMAGMISACEGANECKGSIMAMAVAIGVLTACVMLLSLLDPKDLVAPTLCLSALMGMFAIVEKAGSNIQSKVGNLVMMAVIIAELTASLAILSQIGDPSGMIAAAAGISMVLLAMSASMAIISKLAKDFSKDTLIGIGMMAFVIAGISLALSVLGQCDWQNSLGAAAALTIVLGAMTGVMALIGLIGNEAIAAAPSVLLIGLVTATLALALYPLATCDWQSSLAAAAGLTLVLVAMTGCMAIIGTIGATAMTALPSVIMMTAVVAALAVILGLLANFTDTTEVLTAAQGISLLLVALTGSLVILAAVGAVAPLAIAGAVLLGAFVAAMTVVCIALGALAQIPGLTDIIADGGQLLATLGYAIGNFVGSIVGGIADGITSGLPAMADNLASFAEKIQPFITAFNGIDAGNFIANIGALAGGILVLTAADFVSGVASFLTGGNSMEEFGEQLEPLGTGLAAFSTAVAGVNGEAVTVAAEAVKTLAEVAKDIPNSGGLIGKIVGNNDIGDWGSQLEEFGKGIAAFSKAVDGNISEEAVQAAANAGKIMTELAEDIPNSGGLVAKIFGDNDIESFGKQLEAFGTSMVAFSTTVNGNISEEAVTAASNAAAIFVDLNNAMPETGGVKGWWSGDKDMSDFGDQLVDLGQAIVDFSSTISDGKISISAINSATSAAQKLVDFANGLGDFKYEKMKDFTVSISIVFANLASSLVSMTETLTDFDSGSITKAISACEKILAFASELSSADTSSLEDFGKTLSSFSKQLSGVDTSGLSSFASQMKGVGDSGVNGVLSAFKSSSAKASAAGSELAKGIGSGITKGSSSVTKAITDLVKKCLSAVNKEKPSFSNAMKSLMIAMATAASSNKSAISNNVTGAVKQAVTAAQRYKTDFYNVGKNFVSGMAKGISDNDSIVSTKVRSMAKKAVTAAQKELDIHSPSRVMRMIGKFVPMGFAKGIEEFSYMVTNSSRSMASTVTDVTSMALASFQALVDNNEDWTPTITPVVDMSNVENSASTIDSLFSGDHSFGVKQFASPAINRMRSRNQNDGNADVVSAINRLRGDISGMSKPTYQIDGITYDDRSSVADAIDTLIDAVVTERRI